MLALRRVFPSLAHSYCIRPCFFSTSAHRLAVLDSQYHLKGALQLIRPKSIEWSLRENSVQLDKKMQEMQMRKKELKSKGIQIDSKKQYQEMGQRSEVQAYLNKYVEFAEIFEKCQLNNEWIYKVIGWYNVTPYYKILLDKLLQSEEEEMKILLDALNWMKIQWHNPYGLIDDDLRDGRQIHNFYKNLSTDVQIEYLRKMEAVVLAPLTLAKRNFYIRYVTANLDFLMKSLKPTDEGGISDFIWLFQRSILTMADEELPVNKFEIYLVTTALKLSSGNLQRLMNIYLIRGRINLNIYKLHIKPYLLQHKMKDLPSLVQTIKFVVCSECGDNALLKNLYQLININYSKADLQQSRYLYDLHVYTHYLRIKGYGIKLNQNLENDLTSFCREKSEGKESLNRIVLSSLPKSTFKNHSKYISPCLDINKYVLKEYGSTKRSVFEKLFKNNFHHLKLDEMKIYEKPHFCCFELDFCLKKNNSNELMNVQIGGLQYSFPSADPHRPRRLIRHREIRDEIVRHYGIKVQHVNYNSYEEREQIFKTIYMMNKKGSTQKK